MMLSAENRVAAAYLDWWQAAGLATTVRDEPRNWLAKAALQPTAMAIAAATPSPPAAAAQIAKSAATASWPNELAAFEMALADRADLPGAGWSHQRLLPVGPSAAPLMILADAPTDADVAARQHFAGAEGNLVNAILCAIGLERSAVRLATLSLTVPPGGHIPEAEGADLAAIARHHIRLAKPQRILLLGQQAAKWMQLGEMADGTGVLRAINHYGATTAARAIHHPRLMLERPLLKRGAWDALKELMELG